jgi:hypothetical protein
MKTIAEERKDIKLGVILGHLAIDIFSALE